MEAFSAQCEGPAAAQQAVLIRLLDTHRGVDLLQRHGVEVPSDLVAADVGAGTATAATGTAAVQLLRQLPLTSYSDYEPLIEDAIAAGRAFTADDPATAESWDAAIEKLSGSKPVWAFYLSSGTTGSQKRLPASMMSVGASMKAFGMFSECTAAAFPGLAGGKDLRFSYAREVETLPNGVKVGVSSSINYRRMVDSRHDDPSLKSLMARWVSPPEVIIAGDARTCYYLHLLCALCERHAVVTLADIFAASLLLGASILIDHWPQLMADIRAGRCFSWLDEEGGEAASGEGLAASLPPPPADVAAAVDAELAPNAELADELQQLFDGGRRGLLERLFPHMLHANSVMTGSMAKYVPHLRELLPTVPFLSAAYAATEGMFGIQSDLIEYWAVHKAAQAEGAAPAPSYADFRQEPDGENSYVLMPGTDCYLEFVRLEDAEQPSPPTVSMGELEVGQRYELVVSNMLGLFRFRMGDILRCVGHYRQAPKVVVEGRTGQALNLAGEKLPEGAVVAAVRQAADAVLPRGACSLHDWACREVLHPAGTAGDSAGHYAFYWELAEGEAQPSSEELVRWAARLDAALLAAAPAYGTVRGGMVQPLHLKLVAPGAFEGIRQLAYAAGATAAQYKPPVVASKPAQQELLESHVVAVAVSKE